MAIPVFKVGDLSRALAYYTRTLGAELLWPERVEPGPGYAAVRWHGHELHLSSHAGDGAPGSIACFAVGDVDRVFDALRAAGWQPRGDRGPVHARPTDQTWGVRELYVADLDGNVLRLQGPPRG